MVTVAAVYNGVSNGIYISKRIGWCAVTTDGGGFTRAAGNGDGGGFIEDGQPDPWAEAWQTHVHDEDELIEGDVPPHIHTPGASWSVSVSLPLLLRHTDDADVIEMAEFRGLIMTMARALEAFKEQADLSEVPLPEAQFRVIAYNVDRMLAQALLTTVDKALVELGMDPPCQLQPVESSNIRSMGFVRREKAGAADFREKALMGWLYVAFTNGGLYRYSGVQESVMQQLINADSVGSAFAVLVKNAGYEFEQIV